jgi:hypothetical protein
MRPSQKLAIEADIARRLAEAQAYLDAQERTDLEKTPPIPVAATEFPTAENIPPINGSPTLSEIWDSSGPAFAARGKHQGGRHRIVAPWMRPLARLMAEGKNFQQAASILGLTFSNKDKERVLHLREFETALRVYRRLWETKIWGQALEAEAVAKLILQEDGRHRDKRPRSARYKNHPRKPLL